MPTSRERADERWRMADDPQKPSDQSHFWSAPFPPSKPARDFVMSDPDRETAELRAKLAEAQTDKKFSDLLGEFRTSQAQIIGKIDALTILSTEAKNAAEEAKKSAQLTRWNTVFLVLGLFAAVIALAAFGAQALSTSKDLFEMGAAVKSG